MSKQKNVSEIFQRGFITAILVVFIYPLAVYAANPSDFTGKVIRITDGDTIHVVPDDRNRYPLDSKYRKTGFVPVRMRGIDSPEKNQEYGPEAEDKLASLVLQETVSAGLSAMFFSTDAISTLKWLNRDMPGRICNTSTNLMSRSSTTLSNGRERNEKDFGSNQTRPLPGSGEKVQK